MIRIPHVVEIRTCTNPYSEALLGHKSRGSIPVCDGVKYSLEVRFRESFPRETSIAGIVFDGRDIDRFIQTGQSVSDSWWGVTSVEFVMHPWPL